MHPAAVSYLPVFIAIHNSILAYYSEFNKIKEDRYFIFLINNGYEDFHELNKNIFTLKKLISTDDVKNNRVNFANSSFLDYKKNILKNIDNLIKICEEQKNKG